MLSLASLCKRSSIYVLKQNLQASVVSITQPTSINPCCARNFHQSSKSDLGAEVIGCERLPDLTLIWPFHLWPSDIIATLLNEVQVTSGLPWWSAILVGGALLKLPLFAFNVYNFRRIQQAFVTSPRQLTHFILTYFNNLVTKGEEHALKMANHERRYTIMREGMNWEKSLKIQMFSHISYAPIYWLVATHSAMITGLHWLNRINYIPLTTGGLPWCLDLTSTDPYMILPVACILSGILNLYLHPVHFLFPVPEMKFRNFLSPSVLPALVVSASVLSSLPADFILYMISANLTACILNYSIRNPVIYNELGLLSSGESFNRFIPPSKVFLELNKTLDRQQLLLEQKESQEAINSGVEMQQIKEPHQDKLIETSSEEEINTVSAMDERTAGELDETLPHLNVKKLF